MDVATLVTHICEETGLDTAVGADRSKALAALNRAHRKVVREYRTLKTRIEIDAADIDNTELSYPLSGVERMLSLDFIQVVDANGSLRTVTRDEHGSLLHGRSRAGQAGKYALTGDTLYLDASPGEGESVYLFVTQYPSALAEGDAEAAVAVTPAFHEDLLGTLATCYVLEGYEGEEERASYYRQLFREHAEEFRQHRAKRRGDLIPDAYSIQAFDQPSPLRLRP